MVAWTCLVKKYQWNTHKSENPAQLALQPGSSKRSMLLKENKSYLKLGLIDGVVKLWSKPKVLTENITVVNESNCNIRNSYSKWIDISGTWKHLKSTHEHSRTKTKRSMYWNTDGTQRQVKDIHYLPDNLDGVENNLDIRLQPCYGAIYQSLFFGFSHSLLIDDARTCKRKQERLMII